MALLQDQEVFDSRTTHFMSKFLKENLPTVLDFLNQIISSPQLFEAKVYLEAIAAANHWCNHARTTFVPHEGFITNVFALLNA